MPSPTTLTLALLPAIISAHFSIVYPTTRGTENEEQMINYPCGGYPSVSNTRTQYPLNGAPITINNEHAESHVSAVLALGNNPRPEDFVYQLIPTVETRGPREFCMGNVDVLGALMRAGLMDATMQGLEGMNATIMVSTDSHGENEGLYNCADITLTTSPATLSPSDAAYISNCRNSTGVTASALSDGTSVNANGTAVGGGSASGTSTEDEGSGGSGNESGSGSEGEDPMSGGSGEGNGAVGMGERGSVVGVVVLGMAVVVGVGLL